MKIFDRIVQSNTEPSIHSLWVRGNDILIFGKNGWKALDFSGNKELKELLEQEIKDREDADQEIKDTYLPLSGGEMTGRISYNGSFFDSNRIGVAIPDFGSSIIDILGYAAYDIIGEKGIIINAQHIDNWNNWAAVDIGVTIRTENGITRYGPNGVSLPKKTANYILTAANSTVRIPTINGTPVLAETLQEFNLAPLEDGLVPAAYLPSYVDDVLEYNSIDNFPETGESGKIYVDTSSNLTYRWSGSQYIEVSKSIGLGTSAADAYPGNLGQQNADNIATIQGDITNINQVIEGLGNTYLPLTGGDVTGLIFSENSIEIGSKSTFEGESFYTPNSRISSLGFSNYSDPHDSDTNAVYIVGKEVDDWNKWGVVYPGMTIHTASGLTRYYAGGVTIPNKTASDLLNAVGSTTTLKTINNNSLLGSGNIELPTTESIQDITGSNTYTGANYISKETNLTDAVVQLDEEIKATNDNLALEHANAEATYAKKTELSSYLPLSGGTLTGNLTLDKNLYVDGISKFHSLVTVFYDDDSELQVTGNTGLFGTPGVSLLGSGKIKVGYIDGDNLSINKDGITIPNKTVNDLLNAGGSTTPISNIVMTTGDQVVTGSKRFYNPIETGSIHYNRDSSSPDKIFINYSQSIGATDINDHTILKAVVIKNSVPYTIEMKPNSIEMSASSGTSVRLSTEAGGYLNLGSNADKDNPALKITGDGLTFRSRNSNELINAGGGFTSADTFVKTSSGSKTIWTGTQSEYEAVNPKDANTLYFITEG